MESGHYPLDAAGFTTSGGGLVEGGAFRIVSTRNMANNAAWPDRFEASRSGIYRIAFDAMPFETEAMFYAPRTEPLRVSLYARPKAGEMYAPFGDLRRLATFEIVPGADAPQACSAEVELYRGETFGIRWENGPVYSDPPRRDLSHTFLADRLTRDRLFYAAMLEFGGGPRGTTEVQAYEAMRALMDSRALDLSDPRLDRLPEQWGGGLGSGPHNWIKAFVYQEMYRYGPAVDLTGLEVEGPLRLVEDEETRARMALTRGFLGVREEGAADLEHAEAVLRRFLTRAFRRPASEEQVRSYVGLVESQMEEVSGSRLEDGLHLAVRRALVSPRFLYRGLRPGRLDDFDLASRLSFFLTSSPPDQRPVRSRGRRRAFRPVGPRAGDRAAPRKRAQRRLREQLHRPVAVHATAARDHAGPPPAEILRSGPGGDDRRDRAVLCRDHAPRTCRSTPSSTPDSAIGVRG